MERALYYLPTLRKDATPPCVPGAVLFLSAFLADPQGAANPLPFDAAQGRALVRDMLSMGETLGTGGQLRRLAAGRELERQTRTRAIDAGEEAALERFAETGEAAAALPLCGNGGEELAAALEAAHKVLLLEEAREERLKDARELEESLRISGRALAVSLGEGESAEPKFQLAASDEPAVPWRVVVEAALAFAPVEAVFFTADAAMIANLRADDLLGPSPAGGALFSDLRAEQPGSELLYLLLPAWRVTGRKSVPPEKPWLARMVELWALPQTAAENPFKPMVNTSGLS